MSSRAHEPARPVQYTLRLSYDEAEKWWDAGISPLDQRRDLGRVVDQSSVLRALLDLAAADPDTRTALTDRLRTQ